jgi:CheY-specific phosphatase CheX
MQVSNFTVELAAKHYSYHLSFVGQVSGYFGLSLSDATARSLTANFLGEEESDLSDGEVSESVGELANMFCGSVMSRAGASEKFVLSHPLPVEQLPDPAAVSMLEVSTDAGPVLVWVTVEGSR